MEAPLDWPTPPYFAFERGSESVAAESCLIYMRDGRKALGKLVCFSQTESNAQFQPNDSDTTETIDFDEVKSMRLVAPRVLRPLNASLRARAPEVFAPSALQTFSVELFDNEIMGGDTVGYTITENGLYLFLPTAEGKIVRCFIPVSAITDYRIGLPIGEILVEENLAKTDEVAVAVSLQRELRTQRIGDSLTQNQIVTREQLALALQRQEEKPIMRLGAALMELNLLTQEQLDAALDQQQRNRKLPLGQILMDMGVVDERTLKGTLAKKLGIPYIELSKFDFDPSCTALVDESFARKNELMPLCYLENALVVALENPLNADALEKLRFMSQLKILPAMASRKDILRAIDQRYLATSDVAQPVPFADSQDRNEVYEFVETGPQIGELASKLRVEDTAMVVVEETVTASDNTLVQLVNKIILDAYNDGVSDIHIETYPGKQNTRVRFRKDGTLINYLEIPASFRRAVISRIKVMAKLDISERRKPQDGKLDFQQFGPAKVELRIASVPTANGLEDIVMRVLAAAEPVPIDGLGLIPKSLVSLSRLMARSYGLILVCGPTGSGKTTTLHSLLGSVNTSTRKIWTAEDPIEITQSGLRQVQVNAKIGWTFAAAMRSFLRADPDMIMVGEMRDSETAKVAIEASLTGHLVLSTLHTNSAPESVVRLLDLGMDPFNFADALLAVLAQRLAKTLCAKCKQAYQPDGEEIEKLAVEFCEGTELDHAQTRRRWHDEYAKQGILQLYRAVGCDHCTRTGYKGRLGLHELLLVGPAIKRLIQSRSPVTELVTAAIAEGMLTLKQDGILKVLQGHTDIAQVRAVC